jgi:hypothetical protein
MAIMMALLNGTSARTNTIRKIEKLAGQKKKPGKKLSLQAFFFFFLGKSCFSLIFLIGGGMFIGL